MAPKDFGKQDGTLSLAVPTDISATRVVELAASVFDEGSFVAGVEKMVLFRPKLKKADGDAYIKELVGQIKASKETLKMMLHKKDQLVDACKTLEEEMMSDALVMAQHAEANATAAANAAASVSDVTQSNIAGTQMATQQELQRVAEEKERLHRQNETLQQNLSKIEEQEKALQIGIDNLEEERSRIRDEEHQKIKTSLAKREHELEQRISQAEKAEAAAARARDALASSKRGAADADAVAAQAAEEQSALTATVDGLLAELTQVKQQLASEIEHKQNTLGEVELRSGDVATARAANDELKAIVKTLEASVEESNAKIQGMERAALDAAEQAAQELDQLRSEMLTDKDNSLKMLEDNFEEEMQRKDEENEMNWKSFAASSVEEQSLKLKAEWDKKEVKLTDELKELRNRLAAVSQEASQKLEHLKDQSMEKEQQLQKELGAQIKELEKSVYEAKASMAASEVETRSQFEKLQREHASAVEQRTQQALKEQTDVLDALRTELANEKLAAVASAVDETRAAETATRDATLAEAEREAGEVMKHLEQTLRAELEAEKVMALEEQAASLMAQASDSTGQTVEALRVELEQDKASALEAAAEAAAAEKSSALEQQAQTLAEEFSSAQEQALGVAMAEAQAELSTALEQAKVDAKSVLANTVAEVKAEAEAARESTLAAAAAAAAKQLLDRETEVRASCEAAGEANTDASLEQARDQFEFEKQQVMADLETNHLTALEAALAEAETEKAVALAELTEQMTSTMNLKLTESAEQKEAAVAAAMQSALETMRSELAEAATKASEAKAVALAEQEQKLRSELGSVQSASLEKAEADMHAALEELEARVRFECGETKRAALAAAETQSEHAIFSIREELVAEKEKALAEAASAAAQNAAEIAAKAKANKISALEKQAEEFRSAAEQNLRDKLTLQELNLKKLAAEEMASVRAALAAEKSDALVGAANDKSQLLMSFTKEKELALEKLTEALTTQFTEAKEAALAAAAKEKTVALEKANEAHAVELSTQASTLSMEYDSSKNTALAALTQSMDSERVAALESLTQHLEAKHDADKSAVLAAAAGDNGTALANLEQALRAAADADLAAALDASEAKHLVDKQSALEELANTFVAEKAHALKLAADEKAAALSAMHSELVSKGSKHLAAAVEAKEMELESKHQAGLAAAQASAAETMRAELARITLETERIQTNLVANLDVEKQLAVEQAVDATTASLTHAAEEEKAFALSEKGAELDLALEQAGVSAAAEKDSALAALRASMEVEKANALAAAEAVRVNALAAADTDKANALRQFESALTERFAREKEMALDQQAEAAMEDKSECEKAVAKKLRAEFANEKEFALQEQKLSLETGFVTSRSLAVTEVEARHAVAMAELRASFEQQIRSATLDSESKLDSALSQLRNEMQTCASVDRETALAALRVELEAESTHLRQAAVADAEKQAREHISQVEHSSSLMAEQKANEARREALQQNDAAVADAEQRVALHKARLDGVIAQLDSEKQECARVKTASASQIAAAEARAAASAAAANTRADAAEQRVKTAEMASAQLRAEVSALNEARGATEEKRTAQLVEAKKEMEITRQALLEEKARVEAEAQAVAETEKRCQELEQQLIEADETRRAMHNQIQELRGNVRVFARARPALGFQAQGASDSSKALAVTAIDRDAISVTDRLGDAAVFNFDKVFGPSAKQEEIFEEVSQLVQSALDGYKVCLFSYGQTGSGKTHTMLGPGDGDERGIIPRAVQKVLEQAESLKQKGYSYEMSASYVEIYNEQIRDLLRPGADHDEKLTIAVAPAGGCPTVTGVERESVPSVDAAAGLVRRAAAARAVEATQMNAQSSRSHTLFLLYITGTHAASGQKLTGCLNLVDLAGSERTARSGAEGQRMKEACAINKSLSSLGDVFKAIGENAKHVPYRNSKLTHLLSPCLGGDGKTLMLVNVAPEQESAEESMHSLQFAAKVNAVELGGGNKRAKRNVMMTDVNGGAASKDANVAAKSRRQSVMPLPPGALARRASMAQGAKRPGGTENTQPGTKSTLDRDRFGVRR